MCILHDVGPAFHHSLVVSSALHWEGEASEGGAEVFGTLLLAFLQLLATCCCGEGSGEGEELRLSCLSYPAAQVFAFLRRLMPVYRTVLYLRCGVLVGEWVRVCRSHCIFVAPGSPACHPEPGLAPAPWQ